MDLNSVPGSVLRGAAIGAGIGGVYRAGASALAERKRVPHKRQYGRAIAEGFLRGLPSGAAVGGAVGGAKRMYDNTVEATRQAQDLINRHSKQWSDMVQATAQSVRESAEHLKSLKEQLDRVVGPVADAIDAAKKDAAKPGIIARVLRRRVGTFLNKKADLVDAVRQGAVSGAVINGLYGALLHGLSSRRGEDGKGRTVRDALVGALIHAPRGAAVGAGIGAAAHAYRDYSRRHGRSPA